MSPQKQILAAVAAALGVLILATGLAGFFHARVPATHEANPPRVEVALDFRSAVIGKATNLIDRPMDRLTVRITHDAGKQTELPIGALPPGTGKFLITTDLTRASFEGIEVDVQQPDGSLTALPFLLIMDGKQTLEGGATAAASSPRGE